jgi:hypothetical protein
MNPHKGARLYPQDLDAIHALARAGFLSTDQLRRYFYSNYSEESAARRFARLTTDGFWSRTPSYAPSIKQTIGRRMYVYYWTPANQAKLRAYLEASGQAAEWQVNYSYLTPLNNHEQEFSQLEVWQRFTGKLATS